MATAAQIAQALRRTVEKVVTKVSLDVVANLKAAPSEGGTPIDTSWASANWIAKIGSDRQGVAGSRETVSRAEQRFGEAQLLLYTLPQGNVFITNNVWYIGKLNLGSSPQAQAGFVERGIEKAVRVDIYR